MQKSTVIFMHLESGLYSAIRTYKVHENRENIGINENSLRDSISYWPPLFFIKRNRRKIVLSHFPLSSLFVKKPILCKLLLIWSFIMLNSPCSFGSLSPSQKHVTCPWNYIKFLGNVFVTLWSLLPYVLNSFKIFCMTWHLFVHFSTMPWLLTTIYLLVTKLELEEHKFLTFQDFNKLEWSSYFSCHDLLTALIISVTPLKC